MDFLHFISHLQKRVRSGGANNRIHGIGQGHDASVANTLAGGPSADLPTDAAAGYMNADMLDGYHAKQVYQGKGPGLYSGLNADTLDGVDKSLGHVEASGVATAATVEITFTGTPKQNDSLSIKVYKPDGTELGSGLTVNILQQNPTLTNVANAVNTAIGANATILAAFETSGMVNNDKLTLTTAEKGPRANLYLLVVSVNKVATSTLATDKSHGVYRFSGGGPEEGINADKLDDLHAREHYHGVEANEPEARFVVKPPPQGRGINADTVDSFHAREAYHGIIPDKGTGLNADTLDGVHKLFGHKKDITNPVAGIAYIELGSNIAKGTVGTIVKLTLYGTDGRTPTGLSPITFTANLPDAVDNIGQNLQTLITNSWSSYINPEYKSDTNVLKLTAVKSGERNQYSVLVEVTDIPNATPAQEFKFRKVNFTGSDTVVPIPGEVYTSVGRISLTGTNPVLGIDADMLDGIHASSGHFAEARDVDGQSVSVGINADLVDGLHARTANNTNQDSVLSTFNNDDTKTVNTSSPYLPVADGISRDASSNPTYVAKNPNLDADTVDGLQSRKESGVDTTKAYLPVADGINIDGSSNPTYVAKNPNLDADTVDGYHAEDLLAAGNEIVNSTATPDTRLKLTNAGPLEFLVGETENTATKVFSVHHTSGLLQADSFTGTNIVNGPNSVYWKIKPRITSSITPEIVVLDSFGQSGSDWAFTFRPYTLTNGVWTASSFGEQSEWETANQAQRGYIKLLANGQKYLGTAVDYANTAGTITGSINANQVNGLDTSLSPSAAVVHASTARRLYVYQCTPPYGDRDLFIHVPADPLLVSIRNVTITWASSSQGQLAKTSDWSQDQPASTTATPYGTSDQDEGPNITWNTSINNVIQYYVDPIRFGIYRDGNDRVYLVIHRDAFEGNNILVVSIIA